MGRFTFSRLVVDGITHIASASKKYKDDVASLLERVHLVLLPILVCLIALGQANAQFAQQGKLVGTGAVGSSIFQGWSVSLSSDGNTAIVGGIADNSNAGAAWVFTRSGGVWTQQGSKLVGTGAVGSAQQSVSVSLSSDGNTAIVGGYTDNSNAGAAWVFTRSGGVWTQQGSKLVGTGAVGIALQGTSVSLSSDGNTAIVGGRVDNSNAGAAWVWTRSGGVWTQQGSKLVGTGAVGNAAQGMSVSLSFDGNTAIVGGSNDNSQAGAAWVFTRSGGVWTQQGSKLVGTGAVGVALQGIAISLSSDGNTAIVGGYADNSSAGAAWVFKFFRGPAAISSIKDIPSDQGGKIRLQWNKSGSDTLTAPQQTTYYGLWRRIPPGGVASSRSPMSLAKTMNDTLGTLYDFLTTVPAVQSPTYNVVAQTLTDSTSTGTHRYRYLVTAHTSDPNVFYLSPEDSGYSVDNLPPSTPNNAELTPLINGPIRITWNRDRTDADVGHYTVYRSTQDGFTIGPSTQLVTSTDTTVVDATTSVGQTYYYRVTTVDIHGNESIPTAQLASTVLAVELTSLISHPTIFTLEQNYPNPFNPTTTIRYGLPDRSSIKIIITNTLGQEVAVLENGDQEVGYHEVEWRADVASGIYFYRIDAVSTSDPNNRFVQVKKMLLVK